MTATINSINLLALIPSASGIEVIHPYIFIIGDDSNYLFVLNTADYSLFEKIQLYPYVAEDDGRIKKSKKADLEAITSINFGGYKCLLIMGSGSSPLRETAFLVTSLPPFIVKQFSLSRLYNQLRQMPEITGIGKLNIEGLAANADTLFLFQRGNISGRNVSVSFERELFLKYLTTSNTPFPTFSIQTFDLPSIKNILSGFSGACIIPDSSTILFTASVENTLDEVKDGETLGSYIGMIDLMEIRNNKMVIHPVMKDNHFYAGKLESVAFVKKDNKNITVLAVSDMDGGTSELIELNIQL